MDYILTKEDEKKIDKQVNDIAYGNETWKGFLYGAASVLADPSKCWAEYFACRVSEVTCNTGIRSGKCDKKCDICVVKKEFDKAIEEIKAGLREKVIVRRGCYSHFTRKKNGDICITQTIRFK